MGAGALALGVLMRRLKVLSLSFTDLKDDGLEKLLSPGWGARGATRRPPPGVKSGILPLFPTLESLDISYNKLTTRSGGLLAAAGVHFPALVLLNLDANALKTEGLQMLATSAEMDGFPNLKCLIVEYGADFESIREALSEFEASGEAVSALQAAFPGAVVGTLMDIRRKKSQEYLRRSSGNNYDAC